jgi:cell division cycle 2-like protein
MKSLPMAKSISFVKQPHNYIRDRFAHLLSENGRDLLSKLLRYDPTQRITAQEALKHPYFSESPLPKDERLMPTFPSKSAGEKRKRFLSPSAPHQSESSQSGLFDYPQETQKKGTGFRLRF